MAATAAPAVKAAEAAAAAAAVPAVSFTEFLPSFSISSQFRLLSRFILKILALATFLILEGTSSNTLKNRSLY